MSSADASGDIAFMTGFENSLVNSELFPRKFGIKKSNDAQISLTEFWSGVPGRWELELSKLGSVQIYEPVRISLCSAFKRREAFAVA